VDSMPEGGDLRIRAKEVQRSEFGVQSVENVDAEQARDFIEISVADTGSGISPENLGKIYQPLFTTKARGIGLGLAVVKNLTEANGGNVSVDSEIGKGTVFTVTLPAEEG